MTRRNAAITVLSLLLGTISGAAITLYVRPPPADAPSLLYRGPTRADRAFGHAVAEVNLVGLTFEQAMSRLAGIYDVTIDVEWPALEKVGRRRDDPVTLRAKDATLEQVFSYVLPHPTGDKGGLIFECRAEGVVVTSDDQATGRTEVRAYDAKDLIADPSFLDWTETIMDGPLPTRSPAASSPKNDRQYRMKRLTVLIGETIDPNSWSVNGGSSGSIRTVGSVLVVTQTADNHRQLRALMAQLRRFPQIPLGVDPASDADVATVGNTLRVWDDRAKQYVAPGGPAAEHALRERKPSLDLVDASFADALDSLSRLWSVPIYQEPGVVSPRHLTLHLQDASLRDALRGVMRLVAGGAYRYSVTDGLIVIYDAAAASEPRVDTKTYEIRPWLRDRGLVDRNGLPEDKTTLAWEQFMENVINTIERTVNPDQWRDNGGSLGAIRFIDGLLVVTATREVQDQVEDLLAALRLGAAPLVPASQPTSQGKP